MTKEIELSQSKVAIVDDCDFEVAAGANANAIGRFMLQHIGEDRRAYISRCVSAARYLESMKG